VSPTYNYAKHNAKVQRANAMRGKRRVKVRPLKFHILRVTEEDVQGSTEIKEYYFIYLQQGQQWRGSVYAKDELDAWLEAKEDLRAGNQYLGRWYMLSK
jgi:hypothetical protein